jgi:hypothetical protein
MWADGIFFSLVNGAMFAHLDLSLATVLVGLALGVFVAAVTHRTWGASGGTGHMWPMHRHNHWLRDLSIAGWLHVIFTALELAVMFAYVVSPMPASVVWIVAGLMTLFVPLAAVQPTWVMVKRAPGKDAWQVAALMWALLWLVTGLKLNGAL